MNVIYLNENKEDPGKCCPECKGELSSPQIDTFKGDKDLVEAMSWTCLECPTIYFQTYRYVGEELKKRLRDYKEAEALNNKY